MEADPPAHESILSPSNGSGSSKDVFWPNDMSTQVDHFHEPTPFHTPRDQSFPWPKKSKALDADGHKKVVEDELVTPPPRGTPAGRIPYSNLSQTKKGI